MFASGVNGLRNTATLSVPPLKSILSEQLESRLPQPVIDYLEKKFEGKRYRFMKKKKS